ncbi:hypothetical protein, partial [Streptomyces griseorubiginosus]|uniref:hypothetical protein n=1 Tax=Streptomyces griseorubiginosus TaxID=67304 RepID=UPI0033C7E3DB
DRFAGTAGERAGNDRARCDWEALQGGAGEHAEHGKQARRDRDRLAGTAGERAGNDRARCVGKRSAGATGER